MRDKALYTLYDTFSNEILDERDSLDEIFCSMEVRIINQLQHQLQEMKRVGDPMVGNEQCKMLFHKAIMRRFYIKTDFLVLGYEDAEKYWLFDNKSNIQENVPRETK